MGPTASNQESPKFQFEQVLLEMFTTLIENAVKVSSVEDEIQSSTKGNTQSNLVIQFIE